ncbi:MAG: hypothetical protein OJF58_000077 [Enhydrobacter sp.]|nr:MAG: hypothetical protein OJF58_000077 [Enhydrobacter sp.]
MAGLPCLWPESTGGPLGLAQAGREARFDRGAYRTTADCLTAAYADHVPLAACERR